MIIFLGLEIPRTVLQFYRKRPIIIRVAIAEYMLVYDWQAAEVGDFVQDEAQNGPCWPSCGVS